MRDPHTIDRLTPGRRKSLCGAGAGGLRREAEEPYGGTTAMRARSRCHVAVTASLALLSCGALFAAGEDAATDHSGHQGPAGHQMTHEQIEILKSKIEIYRPYTDEQINAAMSRMYEAQEYLSPPAVRNEIGILGLGHGYKAEGDALFKRGYAGVAAVYPTAVGLGMTMMDSAHIQTSVDQLEAAGAKTIVVLPTEVGDNTSLIRQWNYAFGLSDKSSYLDVPRIRSKARIVVARTPTTSPLVTRILADYVRGASRNPAGEVVVMIAHGPEDAADNEKELANLATHAAGIKAATGRRGRDVRHPAGRRPAGDPPEERGPDARLDLRSHGRRARR